MKNRKQFSLERDLESSGVSLELLKYEMNNIKQLMKKYKKNPILRSHIGHLKKLWNQLELSSRRMNKLQRNLNVAIASEHNERKKHKKNN